MLKMNHESFPMYGEHGTFLLESKALNLHSDTNLESEEPMEALE